MHKLAMGKEFYLEALLLERDEKQVLRYHMKDAYLNDKFFMRNGSQEDFLNSLQ